MVGGTDRSASLVGMARCVQVPMRRSTRVGVVAGLSSEGAALLVAPTEILFKFVGHGIVGNIPSGILKSGQSNGGDGHDVSLYRSHEFVVEDALLPVRALDFATREGHRVFQFGTGEGWATKEVLCCFLDSRRHHSRYAIEWVDVRRDVLECICTGLEKTIGIHVGIILQKKSL